jgi:hypothetical protein
LFGIDVVVIDARREEDLPILAIGLDVHEVEVVAPAKAQDERLGPRLPDGTGRAGCP